MEIFRHYYTVPEWQTSVFFKQHLNNFGFCMMDGSKINYVWNDGSAGKTMRYSLDNKKQTYLNFLFRYGSGGNSYVTGGCTIGVHLSNGSNYQSGATNLQSVYYPQTCFPSTVIFLPLINNGFLLNIRSQNQYSSSYDSASSNPSSSSSDPRDKSFLINTPSPSLNVKIYQENPAYNGTYVITNDSYGTAGVLTFIGLPPCSGNLNWTYLLYTNNGRTNARDYTYALIDYGDGRVLDMPFKSPFIRNTNNNPDPPAYNEPTYTNINENICSMIKMPYDNKYIDGVYLLTTAPQQLEDATFFSFDGRNFLNVFDNYVLELPPST